MGSEQAAQPLTHRVGVVPRSLKNRRRFVLVRGKILPIPSKEALEDRKLIRDIIQGLPRIPVERDVRLELRWLVSEDAIEWQLVDLGPRPKGRKGRSDLQGVVEALCDALQGYSVENDSQVAQIAAEKVYA